DYVNAYSLRYGNANDRSLLLSVAEGTTGTRASYFRSVAGVMPIGVFSHVAVTIQGTTVPMYINGAVVSGQYEEGVASGSTEIVTAATQLTANRSSDHGSFTIGNGNGIPFSGAIDEVSVYNHALSGQEIQAIFNTATAGKCAGGLSAPGGLTAQQIGVNG